MLSLRRGKLHACMGILSATVLTAFEKLFEEVAVVCPERYTVLTPICYVYVAVTRSCRCRIEFWPHWISTRGVLIQRAVLKIQRIFHVELRPQRQGVIELRPLRRIKFGPPVELWPRVLIPRWIMTLGINSTLNFDPESWFNVKLWPGIGITI